MSHTQFKGDVLNYHSPFHVQNAHILVSIFIDQGCNDSCDEIRVLFSLKNVSQKEPGVRMTTVNDPDCLEG